MNLNKNGIYIIENIRNKKVYIGSTIVTFQKRFKQHIAMLKLNKHSSKGLQSDFNEFGVNGFTYLMLEEVNDFSKIRDIERHWIETIQPEYNVKFSVGKAINYTEEIRNKMSLGHGSKPFEVYKDGKLINTYECQSVAARELGIPVADLGRVLLGKTKHTKGYMFKFVGEDFKYIPKVLNKKEPKIVVRNETCDRLLLSKNIKLRFTRRDVKLNHSRALFKGILRVFKNDQLIGTFLSLLEASEVLNLKKGSISFCLAGHRNTLYGYSFTKEIITKEKLKEISND